jgi:hypothetical protein
VRVARIPDGARAERRRMTAAVRRFVLRFALAWVGLGAWALLLHHCVAFGRPELALGF